MSVKLHKRLQHLPSLILIPRRCTPTHLFTGHDQQSVPGKVPLVQAANRQGLHPLGVAQTDVLVWMQAGANSCQAGLLSAPLRRARAAESGSRT